MRRGPAEMGEPDVGHRVVHGKAGCPGERDPERVASLILVQIQQDCYGGRGGDGAEGPDTVESDARPDSRDGRAQPRPDLHSDADRVGERALVRPGQPGGSQDAGDGRERQMCRPALRGSRSAAAPSVPNKTASLMACRTSRAGLAARKCPSCAATGTFPISSKPPSAMAVRQLRIAPSSAALAGASRPATGRWEMSGARAASDGTPG